jgi:copper chaperone NosL
MKKRLCMMTFLAVFLALASCGKEASVAVSTPIPFEKGDECHLCGMAITDFPGPKGEMFEHGAKNVRKFCSTRELFTYYLQPEISHHATALYVHDMGKAPWDKPDDSHLIDAKSAWYVAGHNQTGSMGPTLASFGEESAARVFAAANGGSILRFEEITLDKLNALDQPQPAGHHHE